MSTASDLRKKHQPDPARVASCKHEGLYWYSAPHDECGWFCVDCYWSPGEEPGYSPEHDRDMIDTKCDCLVHDMADAGLVSISNSDHGYGIAHSAARIARDQRTFDQESIVAIIARLCAGDGKFWRERHESILAGRDNRNRCKCGKLSRISQSNGSGGWVNLCDEHAWSEELF
jgi:hypothetical protein